MKQFRLSFFICIFVFATLVLLGCDLDSLAFSFAPTPTATVSITSDCQKLTQPTDQDVKFALGYFGNAFDSKWEKKYTVENMRISVSWINNDDSAIAFLNYLVYSCGHTQADWDYYFSEQTIRDLTFRDYQNVKQVTMCNRNDANFRLYELAGQWRDRDYRIRYWATLAKPTRLLTMVLAYPTTAVTTLDKYSTALFPAFDSCSK